MSDHTNTCSDTDATQRRRRKRQRCHSTGPRAYNGTRPKLLLQVLLSLSVSLAMPWNSEAFSLSHPRTQVNFDAALGRLHKNPYVTQDGSSQRPYHGRLLALKDSNNDEEQSSKNTKKQAISALSKPPSKVPALSSPRNGDMDSLLPPPLDPLPAPSNPKKPRSKPAARAKMHPPKKYLHASKKSNNDGKPSSRSKRPKQHKSENSNRSNNSNIRPHASKRTPLKGSNKPGRDRYASMLPPPLRDPNDYLNEDEHDNRSPNDNASLSSWEQFLGSKPRPEGDTSLLSSPSAPTGDGEPNKEATSRGQENAEEEFSKPPPSMAKLPSIHDLFPPDLSVASKNSKSETGKSRGGKKRNSAAPTTESRDNTFPLPRHAKKQRQRNRGAATADKSLFAPISDSAAKTGPTSSVDKQQRPSESSSYSPTQQQETNISHPKQQQQQQQQSSLEGVLPVSDLFYRSAQSMDMGGDDEELPFSAEQSDQLTVDHNKVKIRRNEATESLPGSKYNASTGAPKSTSTGPGNNSRSTNNSGSQRKTGRRRMVRRGMEMLVGGVPINADPPQRNLELFYDTNQPWYASISVNTRHFGPFFHTDSQHLLSRTELGLFCEFFVHYAMKWDVCPKKLRSIVQDYLENDSSLHATADDTPDLVSNASLLNSSSQSFRLPVIMKPVPDKFEVLLEKDEDGTLQRPKEESTVVKPTRGFGKSSINKKKQKKQKKAADELWLEARGGLNFDIGVSLSELESGGSAWRDVLERGILSCVGKVLQRSALRSESPVGEIELHGVSFSKLEHKETDAGLTSITIEFTVTLKPRRYSGSESEKIALRLTRAMERAANDGELNLALAAAAKEEERWSLDLRERIYEEFLFEEDEEDTVAWGKDSQQSRTSDATGEGSTPSSSEITGDVGDSTGASAVPERDDLLMFDAGSGVVWDYSQENAENAPFQGKLGPRLLEAMEERTKEHPPKVIAVGDVHGCIDELQDLLRQCDYHPGDLVTFLGDLVSKGPDSISVVQMSREIGAIGVRGNHDFEVIRWHQAIQSGVDPPVVGSEHYHVASCLSKADVKWLYSLPWYITSKELSALFVHAGFVSGIRLQKQNPRLMMNMRSILPDGTVTSKFFNNWPWARLWDGPQTVYFGHDADRGLQQYEHAIGLDTGCVYGGRLTACILPEKRLVSVSARRAYFKYRRKHYD